MSYTHHQFIYSYLTEICFGPNKETFQTDLERLDDNGLARQACHQRSKSLCICTQPNYMHSSPGCVPHFVLNYRRESSHVKTP